MKNKTKEELIRIIENLQNKLEIAENDVDYWQCEYNEMEENNDKLEQELADMEIANGIKDINNFKFELSKNGLDNDKLIEFIDEYVRYYNV